MTVHQNNIHETQVRAWANKNTKGLSATHLVELFGKAIASIEQRSLVTLSSITIGVVVDRALHESKERFPILDKVKIEAGRMNVRGLLESNPPHNVDALRDALFDILVELLNVLGNITADILTVPLHKALSEVTVELTPLLETSLVPNSAKKNREKKHEN